MRKKLLPSLLLLLFPAALALAECYPSGSAGYLANPSSPPCVTLGGFVDGTGHAVASTASSPAPAGVASSMSVVDPNNTTSALLGGSATFTGQWTSTLNYPQVEVSLFADQAATLQVQFSNDGATAIHTHTYTVVAGTGKTVDVTPHGAYYRLVYTNGAVAQGSFTMRATLKPVPSPGSVVELSDTPASSDDALLVKAGIFGAAVDGSGFKNVLTTSDGGLVVNQNTQVDAPNSTSVNLAPGATFTGGWVTDLNYTAVQYIVNADQNLQIFIDQSPDGVNNDVSDMFEYFFALGGDGHTVQLVGTYHRFRVVNIGTATTTHLRFQAIKIPFLEALPRTLSPEGNLMVAVRSIQDDNGFSPYFTPFGEQVSVPLYRLVGSAFQGSTLDSNVWTASAGTGGTASPTNGLMVLATGATANNATSLQTALVARFVAGQPNKFREIVQLPDTGTANNTRTWGAYTATDGAYFQLNGTVFGVCTKKAGTASCVNNGSFNGYEGNTLPVDLLTHTYEIIATPPAVYFFVDGEVIQTSNFTGSWTSALDLPVRFDNFNSGGSTTNVTMNIFVGTALRLGIADAQPFSFFQSGATTGVQIKLGAGNMRKLVISNVSNNAVITLCDGVATCTKTIWASGGMGAQTQPFFLDLDKAPFSAGLWLTITGAAANALCTFE